MWDEWVAARIPLVTPTSWPVWAFFVCRQGDAAVERLLTDIQVGARQQAIRRLVHVWRARDFIANTPHLSALRPLLDTLPARDVLALLFDEPAAPCAAAFYERLHHIRSQDGRWERSFGDYLKNLGVMPSPAYGEILGALRDARLDGDVETLEAAETFVRTRLGERNSAS